MPEQIAIRSNESIFVGRERELMELRSGLEDARGGRSRFFLVTGEPGIGKSRLADEVAGHAASASMVVLRAACWEGAGAPPYWPFIQLIRAALDSSLQEALREARGASKAGHIRDALAKLVAELQYPDAPSALPPPQPSPDPELARFRLFDSVATAFRNLTGVKPLMLVLEDLHEADHPSLLMLRFVVRQLKDAPVLILGTYRDFEVQRSPMLAQPIGDLMRQGSHVPLFALSRENAARIIEERAGTRSSPRLVADIYQATAGNPLFIDGLVRVLAAEGKLRGAKRVDLAAFKVPDGIREAIRRSLALLPDRSALVPAALMGQEFELRCLQRVTQIPESQLVDVLHGAEAVPVVAPLTNSRYRFAHDLIRNALCDELGATQRAQLHSKIGKVLEEFYQADIEAHLAELAYHFRQAGELDKAIDYSIRAGEGAGAVFAYEDAIAHWQAALEMMAQRAEGSERRALLLERTAELLGVTNSQHDEQFKYLRHALKLYQDLGHSEGVARVEARMGMWRIVRGGGSDVARAFDDDPKTASSDHETPADVPAAMHLLVKAGVAGDLGKMEQALVASRLTMELAERHGELVLWGMAAIVQAAALVTYGHVAQSLSLTRKALQATDQNSDSLLRHGLMTVLSSVLSGLRDPSEAVTQLEHEISGPRWVEAGPLRCRLIDCLREHQVLLGRLREAGALHSQSQGDPYVEGQIAFYRGDWEQADQLFAQTLGHARDAGKVPRAAACGYWLVRVLLALGRSSEAEALAQEHLATSLRCPNIPMEMHLRQQLALIYSLAGKPELAHPHLARCHDVLAGGEDWRGLIGYIATAEAAVAGAEENLSQAQARFAHAVEIYRRYHLPFEEAQTLHYWGHALIAAGDGAGALEKLDAAMELYRCHEAGERWLQGVEADRLRAQSAGAVTSQKAATRQLPEAPAEAKRDEDSKLAGVFRKQGEYWTLSWAGCESRLKERKGFHYIAWLLRHPGREFAAADLVAIVEPAGLPEARAGAHEAHHGDLTTIGGLGDAGAALDAKAKAQYRRRLKDLREELDQAQQCNDRNRAEKARTEIEFIEDEIAAAAGLGGRARKSSSHAERVRLAVTKAVKAALSPIRQADPELGRHLTLSIRTGNFCAYLPKRPVAWRL